MARSSLQDPLTKFRWLVNIDGFTRYGFTSCSTPSHTITTHNYKEGGAHLNPRNIPNEIAYAPVTLRRGVTTDTSFNKWANGPFDLVQNNAALKESGPLQEGLASVPGVGAAAASIVARTGITGPTSIPSNDNFPFQYRRDVELRHVNRVGQTIVVYILHNAYPIEYKPASDFDAADDEFSVESITLAYEGYSVKYSSFAGALASKFAAGEQ
jgi:phage tail-like protein